MTFPERFERLPEYPFARLRALLDAHEPGAAPISMSIGEPTHPFPAFVPEVLAGAAAGFGRYPPNEGTPELRGAIAGWLARRYGATLDPEHQITALSGTREGLFVAGLALCPEARDGAPPKVLLPNPFYQVYAAAALAAGAEPVPVPASAATGFLPDYEALGPAALDRVALVYACSPSNPQGAVATKAWWQGLFELAERHDFIVLADECYSEIYPHTPPPGAFEALAGAGADPARLVVFNSLSKRSNLPGLRAGFAAGAPAAIARIKALRAYGGAPCPLPLQAVAARAWADEGHVAENRALYRAKYALADEILGGLAGYTPPEAGFFLWIGVEDGAAAALRLWREAGIRVLPGAYLGRSVNGENPGAGYIRVALVPEEGTLRAGLERLRAVLERG